MKRFTTVVLMLCIAMMCTTPFEVQGQNRRTGGNNSNTATSRTKSTESTIQSRPSQGQSKQSRPAQTTAAPQRKESQQKAAPQNNNAAQQHKSAQVQDRRSTTNVKPGNSNSHSAQISRKNSDIGRQNIPSNKDVKPANKPNVKPNNSTKAPKDMGHNQPSNHKPAAVQYHNKPPRPREPNYTRPYLEKHFTPTPSHRYGDHYFGYRLNTLPRGYRTIRVGGLDYYYYDGIYYRPYALGGYYVCRPPRGTSIASTLFNVALTAIAINTIRNEVERVQRATTLARVYSTANTGYVLRNSDDYYVTNVANQINQEYYYQDGVFYILQNGQYYVIDAPIGALVTQIPADYDEVVLDGKVYYLVEDTLYKATVIDGALYFEVVCNL